MQFSCLVEPTPPENVTYRWGIVDDQYGGYSRSQQNFSSSYSIEYPPLPYCYYYCEVSVNDILVGSASKVVQRQGEFSVQLFEGGVISL